MLGDALRKARESKGVDRTQLAELIGHDHVTLWRVETGRRKASDEWIDKYARALKMPREEILVYAATDDVMQPYYGDLMRLIIQTYEEYFVGEAQMPSPAQKAADIDRYYIQYLSDKGIINGGKILDSSKLKINMTKNIAQNT